MHARPWTRHGNHAEVERENRCASGATRRRVVRRRPPRSWRTRGRQGGDFVELRGRTRLSFATWHLRATSLARTGLRRVEYSQRSPVAWRFVPGGRRRLVVTAAGKQVVHGVTRNVVSFRGRLRRFLGRHLLPHPSRSDRPTEFADACRPFAAGLLNIGTLKEPDPRRRSLPTQLPEPCPRSNGLWRDADEKCANVANREEVIHDRAPVVCR